MGNQVFKEWPHMTSIVPFSQWNILWDDPTMSCDVIGKYVEVFGRQRVKVIDFDGLKASGADLVDTILNSVGMPPLPEACSRQDDNPSISNDDKLIMLSFSKHIKSRFNCTLNATVWAENILTEVKSLSPPMNCSDLEEV